MKKLAQNEYGPRRSWLLVGKDDLPWGPEAQYAACELLTTLNKRFVAHQSLIYRLYPVCECLPSQKGVSSKTCRFHLLDLNIRLMTLFTMNVECLVPQVKVAQSCLTLWSLGLYSPWNSPGQNTGVGSLSLLQGIFPTQGSNPGLLHCRRILYQLSRKGSPRILQWVACPYSRGSSWPRNWTRVSCIAGGFFTNWAMREAWYLKLMS